MYKLIWMVLAAIALAACANADEVAWPIETPREDVPEDQRAALDDGSVDAVEYRQAFDRFADCASKGGGAIALVEVDELSGQVTYQSSSPLSLPGSVTYWENEDGEVVELVQDLDSIENQCYVKHFVYLEAVFQSTDPLVAESELRAQQEWLIQVAAPCLGLVESEVETIEVGSAQFDELTTEFLLAENNGRCKE